ncbi:MAG: AAA family ATPase [Holophagales bacterium]|nr:AAA family ATPase [Holophagales bacterium]
MDLIDRLATRRLVVVTGKGGVGKSMLTSALGLALARRGRRTLVLEVDPRENLHQLLGVPPSDGSVVPVERRLYLQNLKPRRVVDWVVRKQVKIEMLVKRVLESPVYHRFVEGAPGLEEMAILGHALRLTRGETPGAPPVDTVVLDAPATGHGIYLLTASGIYADTIGRGPIADLAREVAELAESAESSALVVVTLAEEMPVQEALELRQGLREKLGREPELLVVNGLYPPLPGESEWAPGAVGAAAPGAAALGAGAAVGADAETFLELWKRRRGVNSRELQRLARTWQGPKVELPLLPMDHGATLVRRLHEILESCLVEESGDVEGGGAP